MHIEIPHICISLFLLLLNLDYYIRFLKLHLHTFIGYYKFRGNTKELYLKEITENSARHLHTF